MPDDSDDKKVKDLIAGKIDEAQLMRWFGMSSSFDAPVTEAAPTGPVEDPDVVAVRERRAKVLESIDKAMLAAIEKRITPPDDLFKLPPPPPSTPDPTIARLDMQMIENKAQIAEERFYEISEDMRDDMKECTPQAMLRDLHRPEMYFEKSFEMHDPEEESRVDGVKEVSEAMATSWKLPPLVDPTIELREVFTALRADRDKPWTDVLKLRLPNRRVSE